MFILLSIITLQITESHWSKLREKVPEAKSRQLPAIFTGVYTILKTAVKTKIDATQFRTDMNSLNIPDELAQELTLAFQSLYVNTSLQSFLFSHFSLFLTHKCWLVHVDMLLNRTGRLSKSVRTAIVVKPQSIRLPTIRNFQWRIDVGVTTSWARKMIRTYPSILVRITTTDGRYHQFEMTVTKFHQLRYTIARLLKEFNNLENHPILRIDKQ